MTWLVVWSSLLFTLGLILGARVGIWLEERSARRRRAERREERRAGRWLEGVRETRGGTVMPPDRTALVQTPAVGYRAPELAHEWPPLDPSGYLRGIRQVMEGSITTSPPIDEETGQYVGWEDDGPFTIRDEWEVHVAQAVALTEETDEEFTARLAGWADDIIAAARTAADPYWDGAL